MKFSRSMVLVSNDPDSVRLGAQEVYRRFAEKLLELGLNERGDLLLK